LRNVPPIEMTVDVSMIPLCTSWTVHPRHSFEMLRSVFPSRLPRPAQEAGVQIAQDLHGTGVLGYRPR
jgi:hypothetical protein